MDESFQFIVVYNNIDLPLTYDYYIQMVKPLLSYHVWLLYLRTGYGN